YNGNDASFNSSAYRLIHLVLALRGGFAPVLSFWWFHNNGLSLLLCYLIRPDQPKCFVLANTTVYLIAYHDGRRNTASHARTLDCRTIFQIHEQNKWRCTCSEQKSCSNYERKSMRQSHVCLRDNNMPVKLF